MCIEEISDVYVFLCTSLTAECLFHKIDKMMYNSQSLDYLFRFTKQCKERLLQQCSQQNLKQFKYLLDQRRDENVSDSKMYDQEHSEE
mmetsp:Transcript_19476/g.38141  ORF Transcript_19476/g.38141 Transcript_19476/m.38141 type:complete len:88 (+) Transcript_19476:172-435(+)